MKLEKKIILDIFQIYYTNNQLFLNITNLKVLFQNVIKESIFQINITQLKSISKLILSTIIEKYFLYQIFSNLGEMFIKILQKYHYFIYYIIFLQINILCTNNPQFDRFEYLTDQSEPILIIRSHELSNGNCKILCFK